MRVTLTSRSTRGGLLLVVLCSLLVLSAAAACAAGKDEARSTVTYYDPRTDTTQAALDAVAEGVDKFMSANWHLLLFDPNAFIGTEAEIVGEVSSGKVEYDGCCEYSFRMWADPKGDKWPTRVELGRALRLRAGDFVRVRGYVEGEADGVVWIAADAVEKVERP